MLKKLILCFLAFVTMPIPGIAASSLNDPAANVVQLSKACGSAQNCTDSISQLVDWISGTRKPSLASPLLVNIGPGVFTIGRPDATGTSLAALPLCKNGGYTTFRGSGQQNTVLTGLGGLFNNGFAAYHAVVKVQDCTNLSFENLTIHVDTTISDANSNVAATGVGWIGGGSSVWTNVSVEAQYYAWADKCSATGQIGTHHWYSSHLSATGGYVNVPLWASCSKIWFYGGEILATQDPTSAAAWSLVGVMALGSNSAVEIYGASIHSLNISGSYLNHTSSIQLQAGQGGLLALDGASIHMHGGVISVKSDAASSEIYGVRAVNGSFIHTPDTAFGFKNSGAKATERIIVEGGAVESPFQWPPASTPPSIISTDGSDMFVETDCGPMGCQQGGTEPHLLIYANKCAVAGPWFDTVMRACRIQ